MRASTLENDPAPAPGAAAAIQLDASSFAAVYQQHRLSVYRYLRAKTRNDDDALDLTAITFERAFRTFGRFRARDGGVHAWLLRIARNSAVDAHRRRHSTASLGVADAPLRRMAVETDRLAQERAEVLDVVARLPKDQREVLLLRYAAGLTAREIGAVIGKSEAAVQKHIERSLAALREAFR
jgi:RNA polymerase sigma-70 factor, ECF subfamily